MVRVIIISRNQESSIEEMVYSLRGQLPDYPRTFVLDRCEDNSAEVLTALGEEFLVKEEGEGWEAGKTRNFGLKHYSYSGDFLVLDGDRYPSGLTQEKVEEALRDFDITLISLSKENRGWFCKDLSEEIKPNTHMGLKKNHFMTPGFIIRNKALSACVRRNGGNLFHPDMDGVWGFEDMALGDLAALLGLSVGGMPRTMWLSGYFNKDESRESSERKQDIRARIAQDLVANNPNKRLTLWWKKN
jgi:hypothetical protein